MVINGSVHRDVPGPKVCGGAAEVGIIPIVEGEIPDKGARRLACGKSGLHRSGSASGHQASHIVHQDQAVRSPAHRFQVRQKSCVIRQRQ